MKMKKMGDCSKGRLISNGSFYSVKSSRMEFRKRFFYRRAIHRSCFNRIVFQVDEKRSQMVVQKIVWLPLFLWTAISSLYLRAAKWRAVVTTHFNNGLFSYSKLFVIEYLSVIVSLICEWWSLLLFLLFKIDSYDIVWQ